MNQHQDNYQYAPYYCEENIWHLCQEKDFQHVDRKVVLISNARRQCALWNQRARMGLGEPVLWDYHVIMLFKIDMWQVFDLDTLLDTPTPADKYIECTFSDRRTPEEFLPMFRVMEADEYVRVFSSDRSHMLTTDGRWQVEPPPWPAIVREGKSNLMELIDMQDPSIGTMMDLTQFEDVFTLENR